jgi:hypothetical protein
MITYQVAEYNIGDKSVEVTYTNDDNGFVYKRQVNIPYIDDNTIDEDYFDQILEGQLRGVESKYKIGVVTFTDPNEVSVGIVTD